MFADTATDHLKSLIGDDPKRIERIDQATAILEFAQAVYDLRSKLGLSQRGLARLMGVSLWTIRKLEDAN